MYIVHLISKSHDELIAGSLESANSSILAVWRLFKEVVGKNQDFMLIRFYFPVIWLDVVDRVCVLCVEGAQRVCGGCMEGCGGDM